MKPQIFLLILSLVSFNKLDMLAFSEFFYNFGPIAKQTIHFRASLSASC